MSASTVAAIGALVHAHPQLIPVLNTNLEDNFDVVLPHLVLSDIVRWLAESPDADSAVAVSIMQWLETEYIRGSEDVRELIIASGVEMIPDPGQPGAELRGLLGPTLRDKDPWRRWNE